MVKFLSHGENIFHLNALFHQYLFIYYLINAFNIFVFYIDILFKNFLQCQLKAEKYKIRMQKWEHFDESMGIQHKQDKYNDELKKCLVYLCTKVGALQHTRSVHLPVAPASIGTCPS